MSSRDESSPELPRGVFVLSIDTELAWGCFYSADREDRLLLEEKSRSAVQRLLELFRRHDISATWAIVGHLFLDHCERRDGCVHPEIARPQYPWFPHDWYHFDPGSRLDEAPLWYGADIVRWVLEAQPVQELASHSFAHPFYGDPGFGREAAAADLRACVDAARSWGVALKSFVFPRNQVGYVDLLWEQGFECYRGMDAAWYSKLPRPARRLAHLLDDLLALPPPTVRPLRDGRLWNIAGSMNLQGLDGPRGLIPPRCRTHRGLLGLRRAAQRREVFHLWFHPVDFVVRADEMVNAFEPVLKAAAAYRERGELEILTMGQLARRLGGHEPALAPQPLIAEPTGSPRQAANC